MRSMSVTPPWARVSASLLGGLVAVACCLPLCGCGGDSFDVVPVSGQVTVDDKPLANIDVSFQPTGGGGGPGSSGTTDAQGRYSLTTIGESPQDGAVVGEHRVILSVASEEDEDDDAGYEKEGEQDEGEGGLPPRASDGTLTFTVPAGGTDKADFPLKSK